MAKQVEELLAYYRQMVIIRRFEEEAARGYAQGKIGGFLHLYIGQEAIAVGLNAALKKEDYVLQSYRDHGIALARGTSPYAAMAELFGKDDGCSRGLGGSMHFFDVTNNFLGGYGIVGGHIPLAAGTAFKSKYTQDGRISACLFGEGATNIAGFHESLALAGLWKLPVIFICENNEYAMGTPMSRTSAVKDIATKAEGYGMPSVIVSGHDVIELRDTFAAVAKRARSGQGPTLVEVKTYRFRGHSISDPAKYRTQSELEDRKQRDPVLVLKDRLSKLKVKAAQLSKIDDEVEQLIQQAVTDATAAEAAKHEVMMQCVHAPENT